MSNQFNFFTWIREGVKQSVMMGVADAIGDLGSPANNDESTQQVMRFLSNGSEAKGLPDPSDVTGSGTGRRAGAASTKRLGRSLKDVTTGQ